MDSDRINGKDYFFLVNGRYCISELQPNSIILTDANNSDLKPYEVLIFFTKYRFGTSAHQMAPPRVYIQHRSLYWKSAISLKHSDFQSVSCFLLERRTFHIPESRPTKIALTSPSLLGHWTGTISNDTLNRLKILWFLFILKLKYIAETFRINCF